MPWEEFGFVEPRIHAVFGQAGVEGAHGVTVRVGVAEKDFERVLVSFGHLVSRRNGLTKLYNRFHLDRDYNSVMDVTMQEDNDGKTNAIFMGY
jgi:hypothetical protein